MTREESFALLVAAFAAGLSALGWYLNRRISAWINVLQRLSKVEEKVSLVDVAGTHGNREAINQIRRDVELHEQEAARLAADLSGKIASTQLTIAQLAERLNGHVWQTRRREAERELGGGPSGTT